MCLAKVNPAPVKSKLMWCLYIIKHSFTKELYFGVTNNLERRLLAHNGGKNISTKRKNGKWSYVYVEMYLSKSDAFDREKKIKQHGSAKHELKKRIAKSLLDSTGAG
jgi:putative endonuclease